MDHGRAPGRGAVGYRRRHRARCRDHHGAAPAGPDGARGHHPSSGAQAALTLVKAHADTLGFDLVPLEKSDVHIHVPAVAVPKDGLSAGVAMFMALASLLTGRTVRNDTAMTGEISLRGLVPGRGARRHCHGAATRTQSQGSRRRAGGGAQVDRHRVARARRRRPGGSTESAGRARGQERVRPRRRVVGAPSRALDVGRAPVSRLRIPVNAPQRRAL